MTIPSCTLLALGSLTIAIQSPEVAVAPLLQRYEEDSSALRRFYWIQNSETRAKRLAQLDLEWRGHLENLNFDELPRDAQVDVLLLANEIKRNDNARALAAARLAELDELLPFRSAIIALEERRWEMGDVDPRELATELAELAEQCEETKDRVKALSAEEEAGENSEMETEGESDLEVTPVVARRAAKVVSELRMVLDRWHEHYDGFRPEFSWWTEKPKDELAAALEAYQTHLREEVAGLEGEDDDPLIGDPIGREALVADLATERIPYSPEELLEIAEREFAWCEAELLKAATELGFDEGREALEHVKELYVPPGEQDQLVVRQAREAIAFLDERELVTIEPLCRETWRLKMLSPEAQRTLPFAAYGGQKMLVAYPTDEMDHERKLDSLRGNNVHFSRIVTPHELIPGHHLQKYMAARYRPHRQPFGTPFLVEGWALYWEIRLWELGYPRTPEDRIGMLFWRMHRCARIIVSLRFHLGEMESDAMVDFLVERVGHERDGATAEVRRYVGDSYGPLYQCAYMLGGLQLRALYDEVVVSGRMTAREFHDAILHLGPIPIEWIRASLLPETPLDRSSGPAWKFAGEPPR